MRVHSTYKHSPKSLSMLNFPKDFKSYIYIILRTHSYPLSPPIHKSGNGEY